MSLIDRTFDPMPRRTPRTGRATHHSFGWFAGTTVRRARYYKDLPWQRLIAPPLLALAVLAGLQMGGWDGNFIALVRVLAVLVLIAGSYGALARLTGFLRRGD